MKPEPVDIRIDMEGRWFADGREVLNEKIYKLFCDSLVRENGEYKIRIDYMENPVTVDDAPFSVRHIFVENTAENEDIIWLVLNDERMVKLDPETLRAPVPEALYCRIDDEYGFEARFSVAALMKISAMMEYEEDEDRFRLSLNGKDYFLRIE